MRLDARSAPSRSRCLVASLTIHAAALGLTTWAASMVSPEIYPEPGASGLTLIYHRSSSVPAPPPGASSACAEEAALTLPSSPVRRSADRASAASSRSAAPALQDGTAGAVTPPAAICCPAPAYPPAARRAGSEGFVRLRVVIAPNGRVAEAVIVESSGRRDMDEAAQRTILRQWRYAPARRAGLAVAAEETVRIEFRLRG